MVWSKTRSRVAAQILNIQNEYSRLKRVQNQLIVIPGGTVLACALYLPKLRMYATTSWMCSSESCPLKADIAVGGFPF
jgi:hypothetical protein